MISANSQFVNCRMVPLTLDEITGNSEEGFALPGILQGRIYEARKPGVYGQRSLTDIS